MALDFFKYQGTGNDFVIMDNRAGNIDLSEAQVKQICNRRFGIGADGLMLLNNLAGYDFEMKYYNSDGRQSSMCGNGGRCLVQFAKDQGIHQTSFRFMAVDGEHLAEIGQQGWVHLKMLDVDKIEDYHGDAVLNTGSPHFVKHVEHVMDTNVLQQGQEIRYSKQFQEKGINVNFVETTDNKIIVRTYERGVEDETYSCGTGVTAAALVFAHNENGFNRIEVQTKGGHLAVEFEKNGEENFSNIWLCGPAEFVFKGVINI